MYPLEFSDENKITLLFGFKTFIISYMILSYLPAYIDFGTNESIQKLQKNIDKLTEITGTKVYISPDLVYLSLSLISAMISITVIHHGIKFSYHYFYLNKTSGEQSENDDPEVLRQVNRLRILLALNFFTPIIVLFLYIPHFSKNMFVPQLMDDVGYD